MDFIKTETKGVRGDNYGRHKVHVSEPAVCDCVCVWVRASLSLSLRRRLLLEDVVDQNLKEDEENDDDVVALLQERGALRSARRSAPQHTDAPVNVLLRLLYRFNGTLKFTEVCSFFPHTAVVFAFVSFAARGVLAVGLW